MLCKKCNGEVNILVGRCTVCGEPVDASVDTRMIQDLDKLADRYNIETAEEKAAAAEAVPEIMRTSAKPQKKPEAVQNPVHDPAARPSFDEERFRRLASIEVMGRPAQQAEPVSICPDGADTDEKAEASDKSDLQAETESRREKPQLPKRLQEIQDSVRAASAEIPDADEDYGEYSENPIVAAIWTKRLKPLYMKLDSAITPYTDRLLAYYRKIVPRKNRVKHSPFKERLAIMLIALGCFLVVIITASSIVSCIPDSPVGIWETSENLTVEFTKENTVIIRAVTTGGEVCVIKEGTYETQKKKGKCSLIIEYEDGTQSILYYSIKGDTGTFTNIGNGKAPAVYKRKKD